MFRRYKQDWANGEKISDDEASQSEEEEQESEEVARARYEAAELEARAELEAAVAKDEATWAKVDSKLPNHIKFSGTLNDERVYQCELCPKKVLHLNDMLQHTRSASHKHRAIAEGRRRAKAGEPKLKKRVGKPGKRQRTEIKAFQAELLKEKEAQKAARPLGPDGKPVKFMKKWMYRQREAQPATGEEEPASEAPPPAKRRRTEASSRAADGEDS